ncbi:MAG TPA: DUF2088 domain-containing protein [Peptococcaceae bacterium]|nr:DUF2088 domain-containing protein [Peptococcaceae bacterium]
MQYPKFYKIRQQLEKRKIEDLRSEVWKQLDSIKLGERIKPKAEIAITAGSRGISNIAAITKYTCDYVKEQGGIPFIVPAMGSHGGATGEGQTHVLEKLGISEETMGAEIRSSMEVVNLGATANGAPVYMDKNAYEADGIISLNRVKPHTDFISKIESGVVKMVAVGLGKEKGASAMHCYSLADTIPLAFEIARQKAPIMAGLAILENSNDETYLLKAVKPEDFIEEEQKLLEQAKKLVPSIPCDRGDILIVKEMGKMFSGTGMDTKVIGRMKVRGVPEPEKPDFNKVLVLRISKASAGNALGVGLADITTKALVDQIDYQVTYSNLLPTTYLERGKVPVIMETEQAALDTALRTIGNVAPEAAEIIIIDNTLHLETMFVSETALSGMDRNRIEILEAYTGNLFDEEGHLAI